MAVNNLYLSLDFDAVNIYSDLLSLVQGYMRMPRRIVLHQSSSAGGVCLTDIKNSILRCFVLPGLQHRPLASIGGV